MLSSTQLSDTHAKYLDAADHSLDMTVDEAEALGRDLATAILATGKKPDLIVGIANGAFLPAFTVAEALGVPLEMVRVRRKGSRYKQRLLVIKKKLRIPSSVIMWGPLRPLWVLFQKKTSALEEGKDSFGFVVAGKTVVVVDDCIETGASLDYVVGRLQSNGAEVRTAVYCWALMPDVDEAYSRPEVFLHRHIQFYPWSNNSQNLAAFEGWMTRKGLTLWR